MSSNTSETYSGNYVSQATFDQIQPGKSTIVMVKAMLGEPSSKTTDQDEELWKYSYSEHKESSGEVFLIFDGHDTKDSPATTIVEFKKGIVVSKWQVRPTF